jgi:hypothetical protein
MVVPVSASALLGMSVMLRHNSQLEQAQITQTLLHANQTGAAYEHCSPSLLSGAGSLVCVMALLPDATHDVQRELVPFLEPEVRCCAVLHVRSPWCAAVLRIRLLFEAASEALGCPHEHIVAFREHATQSRRWQRGTPADCPSRVVACVTAQVRPRLLHRAFRQGVSRQEQQIISASLHDLNRVSPLCTAF